jgi:hypothetical protein
MAEDGLSDLPQNSLWQRAVARLFSYSATHNEPSERKKPANLVYDVDNTPTGCG